MENKINGFHESLQSRSALFQPYFPIYSVRKGKGSKIKYIVKQTAVFLTIYISFSNKGRTHQTLSCLVNVNMLSCLVFFLFCSVDHVTVDAHLKIREFFQKKQTPVKQIRNLLINNQGMKSSSSSSSLQSVSTCQTGNKSNNIKCQWDFHLRVYSHQESLLVKLLWSGPNTMFTKLQNNFVVFVCFHTALFASEPETVNGTTCVLKVIHSTIPELVWKWTETSSSAGSLYGCLVSNWVRLLYSHLPKIFALRLANLSSIQSNQTRQVWIYPYTL